MNFKDKLIVSLAETFREFLSLCELDWDEAFFRYVEHSESHRSSQWSYIKNNELYVKSIKGDFKAQYTETMREGLREVISEIEKEFKTRPKVSVLAIDSQGSFKIIFDKSDEKLEINKLSLGLEKSFFYERDINIPQSVIDFQKDLGLKV